MTDLDQSQQLPAAQHNNPAGETINSKKDDDSRINNYAMKINNTIGRYALSKNICRFELPIDMQQFETMSPVTYLEKYCKVNDRRKALYRRVFDKYKKKGDQPKDDYLDLKLFEDCLIDVHMKSINKKQVDIIVKLADLQPDMRITFQLFMGLAAYAERVLYEHFVTEDTIDLPEYQKDKIECADFGSLKSKLDGVRINQKILTLLKTL